LGGGRSLWSAGCATVAAKTVSLSGITIPETLLATADEVIE
jgi:hypothetical protein